MIAILTKFLPFLGPLLERIFPDKSKVAELQAEKELTEAKAFARGRISPKYLVGYIIAGFFALFGLAVLLRFVFPDFFGGSLMNDLKALIELSKEMQQ